MVRGYIFMKEATFFSPCTGPEHTHIHTHTARRSGRTQRWYIYRYIYIYSICLTQAIQYSTQQSHKLEPETWKFYHTFLWTREHTIPHRESVFADVQSPPHEVMMYVFYICLLICFSLVISKWIYPLVTWSPFLEVHFPFIYNIRLWSIWKTIYSISDVVLFSILGRTSMTYY